MRTICVLPILITCAVGLSGCVSTGKMGSADARSMRPAKASETTPATDKETESLLDEIAVNVARFSACSFRMSIRESRFVRGEQGGTRTVEFRPRKERNIVKGDKFYFWDNGDGFSSETKTNVEHVFEGAFNGVQYVELRHHNKCAAVFGNPKRRMASPEEPMNYCGRHVLETFRDYYARTPGTVRRIAGQETLFGAHCVILELDCKDGSVFRQWIDKEHGLLCRRNLSFLPTKELWWTTEMPEIKKVSPGVWVPARTVSEGAITDKMGCHHTREIVFDEVDLTTPIDDRLFDLEVPPGYHTDNQ